MQKSVKQIMLARILQKKEEQTIKRVDYSSLTEGGGTLRCRIAPVVTDLVASS